jgi:hypothetical protein
MQCVGYKAQCESYPVINTAEVIKVELRNLVNAVMNHRVEQKVNGIPQIITEISAGFLSSSRQILGQYLKSFTSH